MGLTLCYQLVSICREGLNSHRSHNRETNRQSKGQHAGDRRRSHQPGSRGESREGFRADGRGEGRGEGREGRETKEPSRPKEVDQTPVWLKDTPEAKNYVKQEIVNFLNHAIMKVEKVVVAEQKRVEREQDRREQQRQRETLRREQEVEVIVERMIKKLEKDEAAYLRDEEDGRPFAEGRPGRGRNLHVYRVRGASCVEWLDTEQLPGSGRSAAAEQAVRDARSEIRAAEQVRLKEPIQQTLSWEPPQERDRDWNVICLRLGA